MQGVARLSRRALPPLFSETSHGPEDSDEAYPNRCSNNTSGFRTTLKLVSHDSIPFGCSVVSSFALPYVSIWPGVLGECGRRRSKKVCEPHHEVSRGSVLVSPTFCVNDRVLERPFVQGTMSNFIFTPIALSSTSKYLKTPGMATTVVSSPPTHFPP